LIISETEIDFLFDVVTRALDRAARELVDETRRSQEGGATTACACGPTFEHRPAAQSAYG
jgi:hypothetical protein